MLIPKNKEKSGIIFEFKKIRSQTPAALQEGADEALSQIDSKRYADDLKTQGISRILCLGMAFRGKEVFIKEKWV